MLRRDPEGEEGGSREELQPQTPREREGPGKGTASRETSSDVPLLLCSGKKVFCVLVNTPGCIKELAASISSFLSGSGKRAQKSWLG